MGARSGKLIEREIPGMRKETRKEETYKYGDSGGEMWKLERPKDIWLLREVAQAGSASAK